MDHFRRIYHTQAQAYQAMIAHEDAAGRLGPALRALTEWPGRSVLDIGAGTGRLAALMAPDVASWVSLDLAAAMLREQRRQRDRRYGRGLLVQGDAFQLPFQKASFDIVTAGWVFGHYCAWSGTAWQSAIGRALVEMTRVSRPGATQIILETLGTGTDRPGPPTAALARYYAWLADELGWQRELIQTDYVFGSAAEAAAQLRFFFGPDLAHRVAASGKAAVPEWTGLWWRRL